MTERYVDSNGYVLVYSPNHPKAMRSGTFKGYVYEHVMVAEQMLERELRDDEQVHHLDQIRHHNRPKNLLVLPQTEHAKLHAWMRSRIILPRPFYKDNSACTHCEVCGKPLSNEQEKYCSAECSSVSQHRAKRPDLDQLGKDITSMPMLKVGEKYGVSDNAIRKWCRTLGLPCKRQEIG